MVAPVIIAAGIAARYGAKKLMKHLTTKSARKVAKKQAKEAKIAGKAGSPTKSQMDTFTGKLNIAGKKLNNSQVMKRATRTTTRDRMRNKSHDGFAAGEKAARKYVKEMDAKLKKSGMKKLVKHGYSLKDMEF